MKFPRIWSRMTSTPWAIQPQALEEIIAIAERRNETPEAVAARLGRELDNTQSTEIRNGVAIVPVTGPLFRYANLFTAISGASSYDVLATDFTAALENPDVQAIVLNVDSPGGDANGVSEFSDMVFAARGKKPIWAYVGGQAASAAYWIASSADQVVVSDTAVLGSIGAVVGIQDRREADAKNGVRTYEIVSTQSPYKRVDPGTDTGRAKIQEMIDALAGVFVAKVARNRGVSEDTVLSDFGQGGVFVGQAAIKAGLADRIGSYEAVLAEIRSSTTAANAGMNSPMLGHSTATSEVKMDITKLRAEHPELVAEIESQAKASVQVPDVEAVKAEATTAAATAERDRVLGILACDAAKGREKLTKALAKRPGMSVDEATEILTAAAPETNSGANFDKVMTGLNPAIDPDEEQGGDTTTTYGERSTKLGEQFGIV